MKKFRFEITAAELIQILSFMLYLLGSALALAENGIELSLWLMTIAIVLSFAGTVFPWLGVRWLRIETKGWRGGLGLARMLQTGSWGTFGFSMYYRLSRDLPRFYILLTITMLLWAGWLILFIYSRYAFREKDSGVTLSQ